MNIFWIMRGALDTHRTLEGQDDQTKMFSTRYVAVGALLQNLVWKDLHIFPVKYF